MLPRQSPFRIFFGKFDRELMGLRADRRGNIAVMMAFLLPVLVGFLGLGFEATEWYLQTRSMQNAADAAAVAAATNNTPTGYAAEALAVTQLYGFTNGTNNVTVQPLDNQPCPSGGNTCYIVTITSMVPLWLSRVIGYAGDTTVSGVKEKILSSAATAINTQIPAPLCLLALDTSGTAFRSNGGPQTNFTGCTIMSNAGATCNGSNLLATYGIAVGTNGGGAGCGNAQISNYANGPYTTPGCPTAQDPTGVCYNQILPSAVSATALTKCGGVYPQAGKKGGGTQISTLSALPSFTGSDGTVYYVACGDTQLSSSIAAPSASAGPPPTPGYVLIVENGNLDVGSGTLSGTALTVVFSGTPDTKTVTYGHAPTGNGTFDIQAPTSGTWSGVAFYQDPSLTGTGVDVSYSGNSPTWNITGLVYMPNSSMTISGAVNKSANGADCMVTIAGSVLVNGTGNIYSQTPDGSGCKKAGLNQPIVIIPGRAQLVY